MLSCCDCRKDHQRDDLSNERLGIVGNVMSNKRSKCGCGIIFAADTRGALVVDGLVPGGSAEASGLLRRGDVLVEVDGMDVYCKPVGQVGPLLLGPPGSRVSLGLTRNVDGEQQRIKIELDRRPTQIKTALALYEGRSGK
eukprot:768523-Hanusia_phi.AAC.9